MINFEKIKQMDKKELARFLCDITEKVECDNCPMATLCSIGYNGWEKFLNMEENKWESTTN